MEGHTYPGVGGGGRRGAARETSPYRNSKYVFYHVVSIISRANDPPLYVVALTKQYWCIFMAICF